MKRLFRALVLRLIGVRQLRPVSDLREPGDITPTQIRFTARRTR